MGQSLVRFESAVVGSVLGFLAVLVVPPVNFHAELTRVFHREVTHL
jgi:hypothetical protein